jgi:peptidoglycan hydrolase-like protein with peptidoglycan-binding domain
VLATLEHAAQRRAAASARFLIPHRKEVPVNKLAIATIASMSLAAIATVPASAQLAPPSRYAQLQRTAAQPADQLNMDAVQNLDQDNIRKVQQALQEKGFDVGPIDGILGPKTKEAVRSFQDRYGMKASGELDNQTLFALGEAQLAGQGGSASDHSSH